MSAKIVKHPVFLPASTEHIILMSDSQTWSWSEDVNHNLSQVIISPRETQTFSNTNSIHPTTDPQNIQKFLIFYSMFEIIFTTWAFININQKLDVFFYVFEFSTLILTATFYVYVIFTIVTEHGKLETLAVMYFATGFLLFNLFWFSVDIDNTRCILILFFTHFIIPLIIFRFLL